MILKRDREVGKQKMNRKDRTRLFEVIGLYAADVRGFFAAQDLDELIQGVLELRDSRFWSFFRCQV